MNAWNRPLVHWYVVVVFATAVVALMTTTWTVPSDGLAFRNALTAFLILGVLAETGFLRIGVSTATSSVAFIPNLAAVILFPPAWAMCIGGSTMLIGDAIVRRKHPIKVIHNASKEAIAVWAAAGLYAVLGGVPTLDVFSPSAPGFLAAVLAYFIVSHLGTVLAVSMSSGIKLNDTWRQVAGGSLLYDFVFGPVALLLAVLYIKLNLIGVLLVTIPLFFVRHLNQINLRLEQVNRDLLELMVKAIEARDPYTSGHSVRVSKLARSMAQELGFTAKRVEQIATAGLLHDVGKIYQEFATLLRKEGKLAPHERQMMQSHSVRSAELVSTISTMRGEVEMAVKHHHEAFNGTGYPDGLAGDEIPIGSRIIAIADTVDAMTTDRPYRKALSYERVAQELQMFRGKQFDPALVDLFSASPRIQAIVDIQMSRKEEVEQPKTVADTFDELRRAFGQIPQSVADGRRSRWQRSRPANITPPETLPIE